MPKAPNQLSIYSSFDGAREHAARLAATLSSATDEQLASYLKAAEQRLAIDERRLALVENFISDQKSRIPGVERDCEEIRRSHAAVAQNVQAVRAELERGARAA